MMQQSDNDTSDEEMSSSSRSQASSSSGHYENRHEEQRDLTNEEMEKLVQLQDLTGIEDVQICRALLESKDWDLEATAREHLNLPMASFSSPPSPNIQTEEAPNARNVLSDRRSNERRRRSLVPAGHNVFSWAMYLLTLPLRLTSRTVFGMFDFVWRIFGLASSADRPSSSSSSRASISHNNTRPEEDVAEFVRSFQSRFGPVEFPFHAGSYSRALEDAKKDLRFLLVYLHSPNHQDTDEFCRRTIASSALQEFVANMNVIVWACSVDTAEGYRVSQALRESTYPFLALIVLRQNKMMVVGRVEGYLGNAEDLCQRLEVVIRDNEAYIVAASAERAERNINAEIRQEQDAAFQETLRMDQERERLKKEAEEAKRRAEEEELARQQAEIERKQFIRNQKIELASLIPDEPKNDESEEAVRIVIKLPEGQRLERRFFKHQSLKYLYYYVFCHPDSPDEFDITTNFPRKVLQCKPVEGQDDPPSFQDVGLGKSTMLFVNDLDA